MTLDRRAVPEPRASLIVGRSGAGLIAAERQRQVEVEGWTPQHDDGHGGDLALAAAAYATNDERLWPWPGEESWKPGKDDIRRLVKAGALIAAEIDRLLRKTALPSAPDPALYRGLPTDGEGLSEVEQRLKRTQL